MLGITALMLRDLKARAEAYLAEHLIDRIGYGTVVIHIERSYGHRKPFCRDDLPKFTATI